MERYFEWAATQEATPIANRAEFARAQPEIEDMLANGLSVRRIWRFLTGEGSITYGLSSFNRDVGRLITKPATATKIPVKPSPPPATPPRLPAPVPPAPAPAPADDALAAEPRPRPKRFHHPESPDMKDYL